MTIDQIRFFTSVEATRNFSEAAENLFISQSSLSKQIKMLERELGYSLFIRSTRKVELTEAGKIFSFYAHRILAECMDLRKSTQRYTVSLSKDVQIATFPTFSQYGFYSHMKCFHEEHPDINLIIEERDPEVILEEMAKGSLDIAILRNFKLPKKNFDIITISSDEPILMVGKDHPFAQKKAVWLSEAKNETFYFLSSRSGLYDYFLSLCQDAGFHPIIKEKELSLYTIRSLVASNQGIALMMRRPAEVLQNDNICIIPLRDHMVLGIDIVVRSERRNKNCDEIIRFFNENSECTR